MATCAYCNSFILFGGKTDSTGCYCGVKCQQAGNLLALSARIPRQDIERLMDQCRHSNCPRCGGPGPVDIHKAHQVWSALVLTSWSSKPELSCKSCATRRQLGAMLFSGLFGWWGFPWGLVMTPVQVVRNITEMVGGPKEGVPSPLLERFVRFQAGVQLVQRSRAQAVAAPPSGAQAVPPPLPPVNPPAGDERYMPKS